MEPKLYLQNVEHLYMLNETILGLCDYFEEEVTATHLIDDLTKDAKIIKGE